MGDAPSIAVAVLGRRRQYDVARVLQRAGMLNRLYTDFYLGNKPRLRRILNAIPQAIKPEVLRRVEMRVSDEVPSQKVVSVDGLGFRYYFGKRNPTCEDQLSQVFAATGASFCRRVCRTGLLSGDGVYACNGAALEIFEAARKERMHCLLEQTIVPRSLERHLLKEEFQSWPGWQPCLSLDGMEDRLGRREQMEWELADVIICGSSFVATALEQTGVPRRKIKVVPYGIEMPTPSRGKRDQNRLNVIFVGEVGLRKGVPYLLEGIRMLGSDRIACRMYGAVQFDHAKLRPYLRWVNFCGHIPWQRLEDACGWADVLVLPSLSEGSALATYEAIARGLPVITTINSGSVIVHGKHGFIVPIRDSHAIASALEHFLSDPDLLERMSRDASAHARKYTLKNYGDSLVDLVQATCGTMPATA